LQRFSKSCITTYIMERNEELALIEYAKTDNICFVKLYELHYRKIFGYVFRRTLDIELTKDIVSETFIKAYQNIHRYQYRNVPFSSWLYRIAGNEVNMFFRKKQVHSVSLNELKEHANFEIADPATLETEKNEIEKQLQQSKDFVEIQSNLKKIDNKYQEVIALRFFENKSIREIAEILNKNDGTVKSLLSRGIDKLRKMF
jgi:RNA polymerase sigma factor (sigma-70 family)